jgi:hypothetical protein
MHSNLLKDPICFTRQSGYTFIEIKISLFIFYILFNTQDLLVKKPLAVTILALRILLISLEYTSTSEI